ncbi:hypothetical protein [Paenibacillus massiliensis]|uniref:hypothetical protein n=1 Tax=Paenibacillus massiliensis TaxID=225917 RepID=UPI00037B1515
MSTLQEILENLDANAPMSLQEIIREEVSTWMASEERKRMLEGSALGQNTESQYPRPRSRWDEIR